MYYKKQFLHICCTFFSTFLPVSCIDGKQYKYANTGHSMH